MNNSEKLTEEIERVLQSGGGSALFDREIVSVLLGAVYDRKQAQDVTKTLMDNCPGIGEILGREIDDLKMIEGMTEHAAAAIECVKEAYKRALREGLKRGPVMDSQEKLIEYVRVNIGFSAKEAVQIIYLDKQHRLIRDEVYFGTIDEVHLSERKVVKKALSMEAASIILAHNHPGGSLEPSEDDKVMTRELVSACQGVGIELEDHIIMTDKGYCSFKERAVVKVNAKFQLLEKFGYPTTTRRV